MKSRGSKGLGQATFGVFGTRGCRPCRATGATLKHVGDTLIAVQRWRRMFCLSIAPGQPSE